MALVVGQTLQNRYRVTALLGQGGMGAVYRAEDLRLHITVAVKEIIPLPEFGTDTQALLRAQFMQEAQILARLRHPHLVSVTDYFEEGEHAFLVMTFVEGESLADLIRRQGAVPEFQVLDWADQILDAIAYCHRQFVLHRDIKPQNIIIQTDGQAILVDFGLVKLWDPTAPGTRTAIKGLGSPEYAPPEQYNSRTGHTDPRSDLYSLGATLYHALTGQAPPTVTERTAYPQRFKSPHELNERVSAQTDFVIQRAMSLPQDQRWSSADEMSLALHGIGPQAIPASGASGPNLATAPTQIAGQPAAWAGEVGPPSQPGGTPSRPRRIGLWVGIAGIAAVLLLSGVALAVALPRLFSSANPDGTASLTTPAATPSAATLTAQAVIATVTVAPTTPAETAIPTTSGTTVAPTATPDPATDTPAPATLTPTATSPPAPTDTPEPVLAHATVSLQPVANAAWTEFAAPPQGDVTLGGVPFTLGSRVFKSQAEPAPNDAYPTAATVAVGVAQPQRVHVLLTAGNAYTRFDGMAVGQIQASCGGYNYTLETLELGRNLREWHSEGDIVTSAPAVQTVWTGAIAGFPDLNGRIDMLTLTLPEACRTSTLTSLTVTDSSVQTASSRDPALNFIGLTVEYLQ